MEKARLKREEEVAGVDIVDAPEDEEADDAEPQPVSVCTMTLSYHRLSRCLSVAGLCSSPCTANCLIRQWLSE